MDSHAPVSPVRRRAPGARVLRLLGKTSQSFADGTAVGERRNGGWQSRRAQRRPDP